MMGDFESHVDILDTATAERIAEAIRNGAGRVEILEPGQRQPLTEPRPEAMADRRQGVSISLALVGGILSLIGKQNHLSLEKRIASLKCALRIVEADHEEPIFETHRGGCQGHA
jgi:hypothetical protein